MHGYSALVEYPSRFFVLFFLPIRWRPEWGDWPLDVLNRGGGGGGKGGGKEELIFQLHNSNTITPFFCVSVDGIIAMESTVRTMDIL